MMKIVALLLALIAAITIHPSQGAVACVSYWTRAEAGKSGSKSFTGIVNGTTTENYNNPLFYTVTDAQAGFTTATKVKGRLSAQLPLKTFIGTVTFDFFTKGDQIKILFTKGKGTGVIKSGKGCFATYKAGTATRTQVGTTLPKVFEWKFCPSVAGTCAAS
jgi:hypothetical protein